MGPLLMPGRWVPVAGTPPVFLLGLSKEYGNLVYPKPETQGLYRDYGNNLGLYGVLEGLYSLVPYREPVSRFCVDLGLAVIIPKTTLTWTPNRESERYGQLLGGGRTLIILKVSLSWHHLSGPSMPRTSFLAVRFCRV